MLVLSRRPDQQFAFPDLGIQIKVLGVRGNVVKVGIQAPREIEVVRGELGPKVAEKSQESNTDVRFLTRQQVHEFKNQLNALNLATRLCQRQREAGMHAAAEATFSKILEQFESLRLNAADSPTTRQSIAPSSQFRTLLVEDDCNERELLSGLLRMSGYEVDTARDGLEALEYLESRPACDLVLLDMCMPRLDGRATIRSIRNNPKLSEIKVFAVSATEPSKFGIGTGVGGIDRWFPKPIDPENLVHEMNLAASALMSV